MTQDDQVEDVLPVQQDLTNQGQGTMTPMKESPGNNIQQLEETGYILNTAVVRAVVCEKIKLNEVVLETSCFQLPM